MLDRMLHLDRSAIHAYMLPDPDDEPTVRAQRAVDIAVPLSVSSELRSPVTQVRFRCRPVQRTAMPEATIDKNSYSSPREHDVRAGSATVRLDPEVLPEAQAVAVKPRPQPKLRPGVNAAYGTHVSRPTGHRTHPTPRHDLRGSSDRTSREIIGGEHTRPTESKENRT